MYASKSYRWREISLYLTSFQMCVAAVSLTVCSADGHQHSNVITHLFAHLTNLTGLSDHKVTPLFIYYMLIAFHTQLNKSQCILGFVYRFQNISLSCDRMLRF